ncbi:hypothetical protein MRX96_052708 [Rhipicephalus microplus]
MARRSRDVYDISGGRSYQQMQFFVVRCACSHHSFPIPGPCTPRPILLFKLSIYHRRLSRAPVTDLNGTVFRRMARRSSAVYGISGGRSYQQMQFFVVRCARAPTTVSRFLGRVRHDRFCFSSFQFIIGVYHGHRLRT